ncbi:MULTISPECIES: DUF3572 domain-containing protein [Halocynthiibacter]|uniref:DUF3572 domain-containing protein n=1 Tax=Halocynthiibacter halioticoli TaxID=2986804 RepID=A0AAE3J097_9RHOB|nr:MULTISPECIES: DUF3572 domain-containing protein [Halocynthiibacter]MCV6824974.1 DUF3572 domain-containing protein [Halocynthiibacter halioticoli]MCW4057975.1 DUF3572 domain-containing protein [Halocynthiibacter sp. SDUM655004]MDE0588994.1 DUF3572 domain-containing protein [Halocynthiibacter sp. C4]
MNPETAQVRAIQALGWLAGNEELWDVFLGSTGASAKDVRAGAEDPEYLGSVLDFVMLDDKWVMDLCAAMGWPFETLKQTRIALPGGQDVSWT